jgi:hypothetical protein
MATQTQLEISIDWLLCNEGDARECGACRAGAKFLRAQLLALKMIEAERILVSETGHCRTKIRQFPAYRKMRKALAAQTYPDI